MKVGSMTDLSPAAQAVIAAIEKFDWEAGHFSREDIWMNSREVTAAALRAAADQVVPEFWHEEGDIYAETKHDVRADLLALAAELEDFGG